ncbi:MAG: hypothetical protein K2X82_15095, partial [Gemmataceae bacterium]|nr:hypothetical protein [Gemmataceae bacterium]
MTARMLAAGAVLGLWAADAAAQWGNTTGVPGRPGGVHGAGARNRFDIDPWPAGPAIGRPGFGRPGF